MKIKQRELNLILLLIIAVILYLNARIFNAGVLEREALLTENSELENNIMVVQSQIKDVDALTNENLAILDEIEKNASTILSEVKQEELIVLLEQLNDNNNFEILNFDFTQMTTGTNSASSGVIENTPVEEVAQSPSPEEVAETEVENPMGEIVDELDTQNTEVGTGQDTAVSSEQSSTAATYSGTVTNDGLVEQTLRIDFYSDFESVVDYIKRINDLNRSIYVTEISMTSNDTGTYEGEVTTETVVEAKSKVNGSMYIKIGVMAGLEKLGIENGYDIEFNTEVTDGTNPFIPYNAYIAEVVEQNRLLQEETYAENDTSNSIVIADVLNYTPLTSFEINDYFFVGSPKDVKGEVALDSNSYSGLWSAKLAYNFVTGGLENTANLVFDKEILVLDEQVEKLSLKVFSPQYSYHTIGMVILDSSGQQHDITFSDGVYWTDWNTLEASVGSDIHYPAVISRIYVKDNAEKSNLNGYYLFDDLEILYSKDVQVQRGDE